MAISIVVFLEACTNTTSKILPSPDWLLEYNQQTLRAEAPCRPPIGTFFINGSSTDEQYNYRLQEIVFADKLEGFPVEEVSIMEGVDSSELIITGILAGVPLKQAVRVKAGQGGCDSRWPLRVDTGAVGSTLRTESILWSGGLVLPLNEINYIHLLRADDGALIIHVRNKAWFLGALSVPFKIENEFWLRYQRSDSMATSKPD